MKEIVILPWEEREDINVFVPDYINALAKEVIKNYSFQVNSMEVIATKPEQGGAIWKISTSKGPKSLKLLHRRPTRSLFSLGAQRYLVDIKGASVPAIVKTKHGQDFIEAGGKVWFVAEWIEPLTPISKDLEGTKQLCYTLGQFHAQTRGYVPPDGAEIASRLYKWPRKYEKMITKMDWFKNLSLAYKHMPASTTILTVIDKFQDQARTSLNELNQSKYFDLIKKGNKEWGLAHQDFGWSNSQMGRNGMWIIDLDGVAYDLPIRDLRKLITGKMAELYKWDVTWVREMIMAYHKANPISPELYEVLLIDLSLPNEFYRFMKDILKEPELFLNQATSEVITALIETEQSKWPVLKAIQNDWRK
ncbi:CotS family spore coat protein [Paenibacillus sp. BSR1-1]|uniref:CotS family spore coat protein n=1 Tax=Paenibacillus sp. BSR1-1 TaxID=3020845 RepID=UPI0025B1F79D|nr:CotS family spore coat protein [Paenibacillus sp. BSR1-1]MDN3017491.1 CotS family spore coat protein [Paenibacillus sp. BSR1-1]